MSDRYSESFASWRKLIASQPALDAKVTIFKNAVTSVVELVTHGLDRVTAADELRDIASTHGLIDGCGEDEVQIIISDAFRALDYVPDWEPQPKTKAPNGANGQKHHHDSKPQLPLPPIMSKAEFIEGFVPPNYLVDGMLQRRFIYALTGQTGHAKTAVALLIARLVSSSDPNAMLGMHRVEKGRVIYFVGENPDDVRMRVIGADALRQDDSSSDNVWYIPGVFDIEQMIAVIDADTKKHGEVSLIIVDTSAAYFLGNEELSNTQMGSYARILRKLTALPGGPCVIVLCHPIKHVTEPSQLLPRGGGAYLAEMDGNLTLWRVTDEVVELYHGKLRGPGFQAMSFRIESIKTDKLKDQKGRLISTVRAVPISQSEEDKQVDQMTEDQDRVLAAMLKEPAGSFASWAVALEWMSAGEPYKKKVERLVKDLGDTKPKLTVKNRNKWTLTEEGKEQARKAALRFLREADNASQQDLF